MRQLPLTVIGGYLGAGKTTLINRLLLANHGKRLLVLVNDFGQINIDASLLQSASEDTIQLTNGCVCCTMSGDLFYAIGDILDRTERPDHLIVEASGIADPSKIASVSVAEPDLRYSGILTLVDGLNAPGFMQDPAIAEQVRGQILCADLVAISKVPATDQMAREALTGIGLQNWVSTEDAELIEAFLFDAVDHPKVPSDRHTAHPAYVQWSVADPAPMTRAEIDARLSCRPTGILRFKAILPAEPGQLWEVHCVGRHHSVNLRPDDCRAGLTSIGVEGAITAEAMAAWWRA